MRKILVSQPLIGKEEIQMVNDALSKGEISGFSGNYIKNFENSFAKYCGCEYGVATTSGTTALHLALATLIIKPNDEILIQTFTNMATFFAAHYMNAKPIPIDSDP